MWGGARLGATPFRVVGSSGVLARQLREGRRKAPRPEGAWARRTGDMAEPPHSPPFCGDGGEV